MDYESTALTAELRALTTFHRNSYKFPLTLQKTSRFCKKIKGKLEFFAPTRRLPCKDTSCADEYGALPLPPKQRTVPSRRRLKFRLIILLATPPREAKLMHPQVPNATEKSGLLILITRFCPALKAAFSQTVNIGGPPLRFRCKHSLNIRG